MYKNAILFLLLCCLMGNAGYGQSKSFYDQALSQPYHLFVNDQKTTVLTFPAAIAQGGVDRGSGDILAKTISGVSNMLKVKAALPSLTQTNLTVVTNDGKVYAFTVDYSMTPDEKPIDMGKQLAEEATIAQFRQRKLNDAQIEAICKDLIPGRPYMKKPREHAYDMSVAVAGIYTAEDVMFYKLRLENRSQVSYDLDFIRSFVKDRKRMKRTAEQEKEIQPYLIYKELGNTLPAHGVQTLILAFPKFTIADKKNFLVQLFEKNGDRNLQLKINGKEILKAKQVSLNPK